MQSGALTQFGVRRYTLSYEAAEDSDISKRRCTSGGNKETAAVGGAIVGGVVGVSCVRTQLKLQMAAGGADARLSLFLLCFDILQPPSASSLRKRAMEDGRQQDLRELQLQQKKIAGEVEEG